MCDGKRVAIERGWLELKGRLEKGNKERKGAINYGGK